MNHLPCRSLSVMVACSLGVFPAAVTAQDPPEPAGAPGEFWSRDRLLGDLNGIRPWLTDAYGLTVEPWLVLDYSKVVRGGLDTEGDAFRHVFGLDVAWETEPLLGWQGGTFFLEFLNQNGQSGSDEAGDFQGVGNWDADGRTQVAEAWFRQVLFEEKLSFKLGKIDANTDFAYADFAVEFINGAASTLPTSALLPTYPDAAFGAEVFVRPAEWFYAGVGVFDGALGEGVPTGSRGPKTLFDEPSDLYVIGEAGVTWSCGETGLDGRLALGGWQHTGTAAAWDGGTEDGTSGFYVVAEQRVWRENASVEGDEQGIGVFAQYDWADPDVSDVEHHVAAGFTWTGAIPTRDSDLLGAMVSTVFFTDESGAGYVDDAETNVEAFYKWYVTPFVSVKPDVQYIANPGGTGDVEDAVVAAVRVEVAF